MNYTRLYPSILHNFLSVLFVKMQNDDNERMDRTSRWMREKKI